VSKTLLIFSASYGFLMGSSALKHRDFLRRQGRLFTVRILSLESGLRACNTKIFFLFDLSLGEASACEDPPDVLDHLRMAASIPD
jgi:hypothetical protein